MPDARLPYLRHDLPARKRDLDLQRRAVLALHRLDRHVLELRVRVRGALAAFAVDRLHEVALPVEQAHGDEGKLEVARRLAVIAGQDAEAARVRRQALVHAELGAEVRDQVAGAEAAAVLAERRLGVIRVERGEHAAQAVEERRIGGGVDELLLVDALEHRLGAVPHGIPQRRIQPREKRSRAAIPAIPEIARQLLEPGEALWNSRIYFQGVTGTGTHGKKFYRTRSRARDRAC